MTTPRLSVARTATALVLTLHGIASLSAQTVTATATALTQLEATAETNSNTVPAGTPLTAGVTVGASWTGGLSSASASATFAVASSGNTFVYTIDETTSATGPFQPWATTGPHETLLQLQATQPVAGLLTVCVAGGSPWGGVSGSAAQIDVDDDGLVEWSSAGGGAYVQELTVTGSRTIRTRTECTSHGASSQSRLALTFRPNERIVHDNGPLATGALANGVLVSELQTAPPLSFASAGFSCDRGAGASLADDFVVCDPAGWTITAVELLAFQEGAGLSFGTQSTITQAFVEIYDGDPAAGGQPVAGSPGLATDLLAANARCNAWSRIVREPTGWTGIPSRPVANVQVALPSPITLPPGTYWLEWSLSGAASLPEVATPPLTVLGKAGTGNAKQRTPTTWSALVDGPAQAPQGLPFRLFGQRADASGSIVTTVPGCGAAGLDVRGSPTLGGFLFAELTQPTPGTLPFVGAALSGFATPVPVCGCLAGHPFTLLQAGTTFALDVPASATLCGVDVFLQGLEFGAGTGCGAALPIELTETVRATIR